MKQRALESGFTLIEVLIAMTIFAVASLGVLGMVTTSMNLSANSKQSQESDAIASYVMEQFQSLLVADTSIIGSCTFATPCWVTATGTGTTTHASSTPATVGMTELVSGTSTGPTTRYEVTWFFDSPGGNAKLRHYAITVAWPRDLTKQVLRANDGGQAGTEAGFIDCNASNACFRFTYHSYRVLP